MHLKIYVKEKNHFRLLSKKKVCGICRDIKLRRTNIIGIYVRGSKHIDNN